MIVKPKCFQLKKIVYKVEYRLGTVKQYHNVQWVKEYLSCIEPRFIFDVTVNGINCISQPLSRLGSFYIHLKWILILIVKLHIVNLTNALNFLGTVIIHKNESIRNIQLQINQQ